MAQEPNEPNVAFAGEGLTFLESQAGPIQAELIAIAAGLFQDPAVDGATKLLIPLGKIGGVFQYGEPTLVKGTGCTTKSTIAPERLA